MTGAMYAAIAGLRTHMQNLNVIGNNVANVNTYGYKASRAVFKTSLYTSLSGGSNGSVTMGGTNPSQIGYGVSVSSVDVDFSSGNYAVTGKPTDLMLDGDGFFLVGSKDIALNFDGTSNDVNALTALTLTRVGNFEFRADGYLAKEDGNCLYGFLCVGLATEADVRGGRAEEVGDPMYSDQLVPIRFPRIEPARYYTVDEDGNKKLIVASETEGSVREQAYDENGKLRSNVVTEGLKIAYPEVETVTTTTGTGENAVTSTTVKQGTVLTDAGVNDGIDLELGKFNGISVDPNTGIITATSADTEEVVVIGCIAVGAVTNPNGVTNLGDNYYKAGPGSGSLGVSVIGGNAESMRISQVNKSLQPEEQDPEGGSIGTIYGLTIYSSGTHIISNGLEMSKTDLAQEISQMILTQRGYQANTRIVTVTDSMLEELVNMKRG